MIALLTDLQEPENGQASMARTFLEILQYPWMQVILTYYMIVLISAFDLEKLGRYTSR